MLLWWTRGCIKYGKSSPYFQLQVRFEFKSSLVVIAFSANQEMSQFVAGTIADVISVGSREGVESMKVPSEGILSLSYRCDSKLVASGGKDRKSSSVLRFH